MNQPRAWKNYPTWNIALWLRKDKAMYLDTRGLSAEEIREYFFGLAPEKGMQADMLKWTLRQVDWKAIEEWQTYDTDS